MSLFPFPLLKSLHFLGFKFIRSHTNIIFTITNLCLPALCKGERDPWQWGVNRWPCSQLTLHAENQIRDITWKTHKSRRLWPCWCSMVTLDASAGPTAMETFGKKQKMVVPPMQVEEARAQSANFAMAHATHLVLVHGAGCCVSLGGTWAGRKCTCHGGSLVGSLFCKKRVPNWGA